MSSATIIKPSASIYAIKPTLAPPSASRSYEQLCKYVLSRRMLRVLGYSATSLCLSASLWSFSPRNGILRGIIASLGIKSIILLIPMFLLGVLPSFVHLRLSLRSAYAKPPLVAYSSLWKRSTSLILSPLAVRHMMLYALQGGVLGFAYCIMADIREWNDPKLSPFTHSTRRKVVVNERFIFVVASNSFLGALYAAQGLIRTHYLSLWPDLTTPPPHRPNFIPRMRKSIPTAFKLGVASAVAFTVVYWIGRLLFWRSFLYVVFFLRPYMQPFLRAKTSPLALELFLRVLTLNALCAVVWETLRALFDVYSSEPIVVSHHASDPNPCLISGIVSTDVYIKHHAFHELATLAKTTHQQASSRRKALFSDLKTPHPASPSSPSLTLQNGAWSVLSREALLVLGRDYQRLLRRGGPILSAPAPTAATNTPAGTLDQELKPKPSTVPKPAVGIFRIPPRPGASDLLAESFASDGAATGVMSEMVEGVSTVVPKIFLSEGLSSSTLGRFVNDRSGAANVVQRVKESGVDPVLGAIHSGEEMMKKVSSAMEGEVKVLKSGRVSTQAKGLVAKLWDVLDDSVIRKLPPSLRFRVYEFRWMLTESSVEKVEGVLSGRKMDVWIVESLTYLAAHSLREDSYGVVQRDLPRIIEALLSFLSALEAFARELELEAENAPPPSKDVSSQEYVVVLKRRENQAIGKRVGPLRSTLREGLKLIVSSFGERLEAFKFSPATAKELQALIDGY